MLKPLVLAATLTLALTVPVAAAPDQVWRDIPAEAPIAVGLDWRPGQWDALTRQPRTREFLEKLTQELASELWIEALGEGQAFVPHLGAQAALGVNFAAEEDQRWLVLSWEAQNPAAIATLLAEGVQAKKWQIHDLPQGEPLFVSQPLPDQEQRPKELLALQLTQGRLRVYVASDLAQVERLMQSPALAPQLEARMQAHADKGLWFVGEPERFNMLRTLLLGVSAPPEPSAVTGGPVMMGVGLDAQGLHGQAWQRDQPVLGAPLDLEALAPLIGADSFFFQAFTLKTPLIDTLQGLSKQLEASPLGKEWGKWQQAVVNHAGLNWAQVSAGLNGQMAWSATLSPDQGDPTPTLQAYLGTAQPQQSYQALQALRFNPQPFAELVMGESLLRAQSSSVKANAHTLQTMVETFGVDYGGMYPEDLTTLIKAAKGENPYWREITNPVTQKTGVGQALDSLRNVQQKGFPTSAAGQIFYEPVGKRVALDPAQPKLGGYPGYRIYAYVHDGSPFVLTAQDTPERAQPLPLKPWPKAVDPGRRMTWRVTSTSPALQLHDSLDGAGLPLWLTENGGFLRLGNRPEALLQPPAESLLKRPDFQAARTQTTPRQVVYLHFPKLFQLLPQLEKDLSPAVGNCLESLEHFMLEERATPEGSDLRFRLKVDMARFDIAKIETCIQDATGTEREAKRNQHALELLARNRDLLAMMLEVQSLTEGAYPAQIDALEADALDIFLHPITQATGVGPRGALVDYADFERFGPGTLPGMLLYQPLRNAQRKVIGFKLYITDLHGQLLRDEKGQVSIVEKLDSD